MAINPYIPTPFSAPIANPAVGAFGVAFPYLSISEYRFAPTSVDTNNLVPGGDQAAQDQSLANTILRASGWADEIVFGADPSAKGASLCATISTEVAQAPILNGEIRLVCDYKPIVQVIGVDIGPSMSMLSSIGDTVASQLRIGRRTLYVPIWNVAVRQNDIGNPNPYYGSAGTYTAVWSYVSGYPHTKLTSPINHGDTTCRIASTDGGLGHIPFLGVIPGQTQLTIVDGVNTESFLVAELNGTVVTSATPFVNDHPIPTAPDFVPVSALPNEVTLAVIYLTNAIIKSQGDGALVLREMSPPEDQEGTVGDMPVDVKLAKELLQSYRVRMKSKN